ncbi:hypothetical protein DFQ30_003757, partial [Apophysomyces sp. BC1015]
DMLHLMQTAQNQERQNAAIISTLESIKVELASIRADLSRNLEQGEPVVGLSSSRKEIEPKRTILHTQVVSKRTNNLVSKCVHLDDVVQEIVKHGGVAKEDEKPVKHNLKFAAKHVRDQLRQELVLGKMTSAGLAN